VIGAALAAEVTAQTVSSSSSPDAPKFAVVSGTKLAYVESGRGVPVVLVHGAFSDYRYWASQLAAGAAAGFRVIAYSRRDFHPNASDSDAALQTADRDAADLIELIEALDLAPAHLVGHSAGGHTALSAAVRRPDLVRSLVLEEGGFVSDHPTSMRALAEIQPVIARSVQLRAAGDREASVRNFIDFVSGDGYFDAASTSTRQIYLDNEHATGLRLNAELTCAEAGAVELPVLMVLGERSPRYVGEVLSGVRECLRNEQTVTIPGASHGIHYEQPDAFNRAVFSFIAEH
jgi:pimeloyl-ACP methyl ester carboxylesterase